MKIGSELSAIGRLRKNLKQFEDTDIKKNLKRATKVEKSKVTWKRSDIIPDGVEVALLIASTPCGWLSIQQSQRAVRHSKNYFASSLLQKHRLLSFDYSSLHSCIIARIRQRSSLCKTASTIS